MWLSLSPDCGILPPVVAQPFAQVVDIRLATPTPKYCNKRQVLTHLGE